MEERILIDHLLDLSRSLDEYRAATRKAEAHYRFEVEKLWDDQAELRDEVTGGLAALSNRLESLARGLTVDPAQVAESMFRCVPDESGGVRDADA